jgi:hypothetical protein
MNRARCWALGATMMPSGATSIFLVFLEKLGINVVGIAKHDFPEMTKKLVDYWDN